jgi:hypothetical protein
LFTFGSTPVVVIHVAERFVGKETVDLTNAVRHLAEEYQIRVIVKGEPNSIDASLLRTNRADVVEIQPMTKDMIWSLPQLQDLFKIAKEEGLEHVLWAVFGGNPSKYEVIWSHYSLLFEDGIDKKQLLGKLICKEIEICINLVRDSNLHEIIALFDPYTQMILGSSLKSKNLKRPFPDQIFREFMKDGVSVLIPSSSAILTVLLHKLRKVPSLEELEAMTISAKFPL